VPERVRITDVAPRDGLQNEPGIVPTARKLQLVELLGAGGVDEVEVTSFVSPKWIPQLADAEEVLRAAVDAFAGREGAPMLSALVPNAKGLDRAAAFHSAERPLKIGVFIGASETFNLRNVNATIDETIERFEAFVPRAFEMGMLVRFYISCVVACPFEGPTRPAVVRDIADRLLALASAGAAADGRAEVDLGDTIGAATPPDIKHLLGAFEEEQIGRLVLHLHDTFGTASDCAAKALDLGVRSFDGAAGGLGGCPYAGSKDKRAPGNIDTGALVRRIHEEGFETGVDLEALDKAGAYAQEIREQAAAGEGDS
jgi:hydroxymethylglutaryl-CoA lyase